MTVLGIATRAEEQTDLAALRKGLDADFASAVLPIGVELNTIQSNQAAILSAISALATQLTTLQNTMESKMSALDDAITQLQADVANLTTVDQSAIALINGFAAQMAKAIADALAAGATATQLQSLTDMHTAIVAQDSSLAAAVSAGTTTPTP